MACIMPWFCLESRADLSSDFHILFLNRVCFTWPLSDPGCARVSVCVRACECTCVWPSAVHHSFSKSQSCSCLQHLAALRSLMPAKVRGSDLSAFSWEAVCGPALLLEHRQHPWHPGNTRPVDEKLVFSHFSHTHSTRLSVSSVWVFEKLWGPDIFCSGT